jgi:hypothetical protein
VKSRLSSILFSRWVYLAFTLSIRTAARRSQSLSVQTVSAAWKFETRSACSIASDSFLGQMTSSGYG